MVRPVYKEAQDWSDQCISENKNRSNSKIKTKVTTTRKRISFMAFPLPEIRNFNRINYQILDTIGEGGPSYLRNISMIWGSSLDTATRFSHEFNTYGFRDKEWKEKKKNGKKRIFFVGDSFVEGMMSTPEQRITESFAEAALANDEAYDIFNCGMMGIGLNEYIKFIADAVPVFKPDELFLVLYANDIPFQREYQPSTILEPEYYNRFRPRLLEILEAKKNVVQINNCSFPTDLMFRTTQTG